MAPEIIYSETSTGVFEPQLTPAQKRKATIEAKRKREKRDELISMIGVGAILVLGAVIYVLSVLVAFGGMWVK